MPTLTTTADAVQRRALIISAGGSRGAFAVGAIRALEEKGMLNFALVAGSSTGALIAPLVAINDIATLRRVYTSTSTKQVIRKRCLLWAVLFGNSLYDTRPLKRLIDTFLPDQAAEAVLKSPMRVALACTQLQTGEVVFFSNRAAEHDTLRDRIIPLTSPEMLRTAMLASCNQPILMPPITIGDRQYMDGGIRDISPVEVALLEGIRDITVINLSPEKTAPDEREFTKLLPIMGRALRLMISEIGEGDLEKARLAGARLTVIRPQAELNKDPMVFDPREMQAMMELGYAAANHTAA